MIQILSTRSVSWSVNSWLVKHHIFLSLNGHSNRIDFQKLPQSVFSIIVLLYGLILHYFKFILYRLSIADVISSCVRILTLFRYLIIQYVFQHILRHSSSATVVSVLLGTIHDFLLTQNSQISIRALFDFDGRLYGSNCCKSVAGTALALILYFAHSILSQPINLLWFILYIFQVVFFVVPFIFDRLHKVSLLELFPSKVRKLVFLKLITNILFFVFSIYSINHLNVPFINPLSINHLISCLVFLLEFNLEVSKGMAFVRWQKVYIILARIK